MAKWLKAPARVGAASFSCPEKMATEERRLTGKQERFIQAYLGPAKMNATEAARLAGYAVPHPTGAENLRNRTIRARIDEVLLAESMSAAEVLHELTDVAKAEWREFIEIKQDKMGRRLLVKMDLTNKVRSLELIGKAHKLFTDAVQHSGEVLIRGYDGVNPDDV